MPSICLLVLVSLFASGATATAPEFLRFKRSFLSTPTRLALDRLRGGSISLHPDVTVDVTNMALALRFTAEMNRRLQVTSEAAPRITTSVTRQAAAASSPSSGTTARSVRGGAECTFRIHESVSTKQAAPLSIFHAKSPRLDRKLVGASRWGPDLHAYLEHLQTTLDLSTIDLVHAMIYMDRACSLDTPRSDGASSVPFGTPRTLHRLLLTSMILTKQRRQTDAASSMQDLYAKLTSLGVSKQEMQQMVTLMRSALGDAGLFVGEDQLREWEDAWMSKFPARHATSDIAT